ncbi:MAG: MFS transporter [Verrucomicrobia bacterium]|nr:MFS transporter [Verrucomicrobiota bacterium]
MATISVSIFAALLPTGVASATLEQRTAALKQIIWIFTGLVFGVAVLVWFSIPETNGNNSAGARKKLTLEGVRKVLPMPAIWLQATIVVCAYVGIKSTADFSLYARDAFGYDDVAAARLGTISLWVRPFAAIGVGLLGDRFGSSLMIIFSILVVIAGSLVIAIGALGNGIYWILICTVAGTSAGIYALRGIYFALFEEARIPLAFTGSAIGLVSVIGYTPDIFTGPLFGYLIDRSPGALGHQHVFVVVAGFAIMGLIATLLFRRVTRVASSPGESQSN